MADWTALRQLPPGSKVWDYKAEKGELPIAVMAYACGSIAPLRRREVFSSEYQSIGWISYPMYNTLNVESE